jgi:DNA polymerase-3 subunit epsilon
MQLLISACGEMPIYGVPVATLDVETTGIGSDARICQIAIIHSNLGKGNQTVAYSSLVNPEIPIPPDTSAIHGIKDEDVRESGAFSTHYEAISKALEGRLLAAYNLPFDWRVLNSDLKRIGKPQYSFFGVCGLVLAREVDSGQRGRGVHKLESVCSRRGMSFKAHCAEADAMVTSQLLDRLLREAANEFGKFGAIREYWAWQRRSGITQEEDYRSYLRGRGKTRGEWPWTDL